MEELISLLISVAIQVVTYALTPKPKTVSGSSVQDFDVPTADAGIPVGVLFGRMTLKSPNILHWTDKATHEYQIKV